MKFLSEEMLNITSFPLTFSYYRFFILGYFMGRIYEDKNIKEKLKQAEIQTIISAFSIVLFILFSILVFSQSPVLSFMPITLIQLVLSISFFLIIYKSDSFVHPFISKLSGYLGNNSLAIYVFHVFFVYEFRFQSFVNLLPASYQILFAMALTIVVLIATLTIAIPFKNNKYLSLIFLGQKK